MSLVLPSIVLLVLINFFECGFKSVQCPQVLIPCYDSELLKKLEVMVKRAAVYMEKSGAASWWQN